jgi:hypothetical protein
VLSAAECEALSDAAVLARLAQHNSGSRTASSESVLTVGESFYLGTAYVLASYMDLRGNEVPVRIPFEIQRAYVALSAVSREGNTGTWHLAPNSYATYYFIWIGESSAIDSYGADPAADIDAFAGWLFKRPSGTVSILWNRSERDVRNTSLEEG